MSIVFVGHGGHFEGVDLAVPPGVTVKFFVDYDTNMSPINVEQVLSTRAFGSPNQSYERGTGATPNRIPNYVLGPLSSEELQLDLSVASSLEGVLWTEVVTALCTTPGVCQTLPEHTCSGLLGQAAKAGETEIVFLGCRGRIGGNDPRSNRLGEAGTDESVQPELVEWATGFLARAQADPAAAASEWDGLPEGTRGMLLNFSGIRTWSEARERTSPSAPAAVLEARRYLEAYGDLLLMEWADVTWDGPQRSVAMSDPDIAAAYHRGVAEKDRLNREALLGGAGGVGDELAVAAASVKEQCVAIATTVDQLTGTDADNDPVAGIGTAFGTMMEEVVALQHLAESRGRTDVVGPAAGTYDAGANVGVQLAMYAEGEGPDAEKLATLGTAASTLNQWAVTIPAA